MSALLVRPSTLLYAGYRTKKLLKIILHLPFDYVEGKDSWQGLQVDRILMRVPHNLKLIFLQCKEVWLLLADVNGDKKVELPFFFYVTFL